MRDRGKDGSKVILDCIGSYANVLLERITTSRACVALATSSALVRELESSPLSQIGSGSDELAKLGLVQPVRCRVEH